MIRPIAYEDLHPVAALHRRVFGGGSSDSQELRQRVSYLRQVFLQENGTDPTVTSYVAEEEGGRITGFLGVVPRTMTYLGKPVIAGLSTQFIVDPESRYRMVGLQLLKRYFAGPQDLSIADEANDRARTVWEGFGGTTASLYSFSWTRVLRPVQYALSKMRQRRGWAPAAVAGRPIGRLLDAIAVNVPRSPLRLPHSGVRAESMSAAELLWYQPQFHRHHKLRPEFTLEALEWLQKRAQDKPDYGAFNRVAVKNAQGGTVGWYLYYLKRGGTSEVLQMAAEPQSAQVVLCHLLHHAWHGGSAAVSGRLQPEWMPLLSKNHCFYHRGPWVLVHSKRPDLVQAFYEGSAWFSRVEGEWCLRYQ
jgi:hypothetical protein